MREEDRERVKKKEKEGETEREKVGREKMWISNVGFFRPST
jgi:hypothetical protein